MAPLLVLDKPKIELKSPSHRLQFSNQSSIILSSACKLIVKITFSNAEKLDCAIGISIHPKFNEYFKLYPNNEHTNEYELYRYYGKVNSNAQFEFNFQIQSNYPISAIPMIGSKLHMIITVYNCNYSNIKKSETIAWEII